MKIKDKISKSSLAIQLSQLEGFHIAKVSDEQYETDSEIASEVLWNAYSLGDIKDAVIADLGCGTGILGLGSLILGAKKVYFIDKDEKAVEKAKNNLKMLQKHGLIDGKAVFICQDIKDIGKVSDNIDVVIQNPPFGVKKRHADKPFLEKAMQISSLVYSFHKSESHNFIKSLSKDNSFNLTHVWEFNFPIKAKFSFHRRKIHRIPVICVRLQQEKTI